MSIIDCLFLAPQSLIIPNSLTIRGITNVEFFEACSSDALNEPNSLIKEFFISNKLSFCLIISESIGANNPLYFVLESTFCFCCCLSFSAKTSSF